MRVFKLAQTWSTMRRILAIMMSSLGALANLTLVLAIIIYIFAIIGMQLFSNAYTRDKFEPDEVPRSVSVRCQGQPAYDTVISVMCQCQSMYNVKVSQCATLTR